MQVITGVIEAGIRRELLYAGDLLMFEADEPMAELCNLPRAGCRTTTDHETYRLAKAGESTMVRYGYESQQYLR